MIIPQATGCKMVLSGEGSDEIMAGYLYFHKAPNPAELHRETVRWIDRQNRQPDRQNRQPDRQTDRCLQ